jgi:hypothetical protein
MDLGTTAGVFSMTSRGERKEIRSGEAAGLN